MRTACSRSQLQTSAHILDLEAQHLLQCLMPVEGSADRAVAQYLMVRDVISSHYAAIEVQRPLAFRKTQHSLQDSTITVVLIRYVGC